MKLSLDTNLFDYIQMVCEEQSMKLGTVRTCAWALANLMKYKNKTKKFIEQSVNCLATLLFITDPDIVIDSLVGMENMLKVEEEDSMIMYKLDCIIGMGLIPKFVTMLDDLNINIKTKTMNVISILTSYDHPQIEDQLCRSTFFSIAHQILENEGDNDASYLKSCVF
jgi:hypothetical protein